MGMTERETRDYWTRVNKAPAPQTCFNSFVYIQKLKFEYSKRVRIWNIATMDVNFMLN